ncbi:arginase [Pseudogracilibacillus auburnensis]|uniref:Arginase n=1 Tax=Pseudogracilibacillus auburnensis TaxID=1494959 RepID=A0A2V3WA82_9BACI|nr:arginase [Pseudogracilibacillus auburnensis]MBO1004041.1 arginase [Pseudogracilibacillus auburnensis]PXW85669.1 arginase [Pseudogracilibacillus auburnensis]
MKKEISIIGVPMDLGQTRRGVDMGPSAIRYAGIIERLERLQYTVHDLGNIDIPRPDRNAPEREDKLRNLPEVVDTNKRLAEVVDEQVEKNFFPLVLGGDHSIAIGSIAGVSKHYENLGVIWYDAHGDINTVETSPSGNIHGMPLAVNLGLGHQKLTEILYNQPKIKAENVVLIGVRDLDEGEKDLLRKLNIKVYTMHEIDRIGMPQVIKETIEYLKERTDGVHLSFDLDGINPSEAPGVGTPVIGGVTYRESHLALEMLAESNIITSAEFVEVNPMLDDKNKTAILTVALVGSLFGEKLF